ncbi:MAG: enoyl-CoA hydratase/isomerase family protein [Deferribacterota bacterium]|nr:enoyl-CoA hydratase/isomerase family protein [Deferribacterota bacterium]
MSEEVLYEKKDNLAFITLNRAEKYNTFNLNLAKKLNEYLMAADNDKDIKLVIINAKGKHFSCGIDMKEFKDRDYNEMKSVVKLMDLHNHTITKMSKVVIASVRGYALANGAGLSFASDFTIASNNAIFGTTAINVGLLCLGPLVPLTKIVGKKIALEMILTGKMISAEEAFRLGIANKVVSDDELETETLNFANEIASKNQESVRLGKYAINTIMDMPYHYSLDYMSELFSGLTQNEDAKKGVEAFLNKKK